MNIVICGAGKFGLLVALGLLETGEYNITIIEKDQTLTDKYNELYDLKCIHGSASDIDVLSKANINTADAIICLMSKDELNILACELAHHLFSVPVKISRLSNNFYEKCSFFLHDKNIFSVNSIFVPEQDIVDTVINSINICGADEVFYLLEKKVCFLKILVKENMPIVGVEIERINKLFPEVNFHIILTHKHNTNKTIIDNLADNKSKIELNDHIYLLCSSEQLPEIVKLFGCINNNISKMIIASNAEIGTLLTQSLLSINENLNLSFISSSEDDAIMYNSRFPGIDIFLGDFSQIPMLQAANVAKADLFLALSSDINKNITASLLSKSLGCAQSFTLVYNKLYQDLKDFTQIDLFINPQSYLISKILNNLYNKFNYIYAISPKEHYIAELTITSELANLTITEINEKIDALVIGFLHKGKIQFTFDESSITNLHDKIVILASLKKLIKINNYLTNFKS